MLLLFDIGNSNTKISIYNENDFLYKWTIINGEIKNINDFEIVLDQLFSLDNFKLKNIEYAIISSINPRLKAIHKEFLELNNIKYIDIEDNGIKININSVCENIKEFGSDIICNIIAGKKRFKENFIIIDMGTATTFTIVGENGVHIGEVIAPGLHLIKDSLNEKCPLFEPFTLTKEDTNIIADNVFSAMNGGIYYGYVGLIKEIIAKIKSEYKNINIICATGGISNLYIHYLDFIDLVVPNLTMEGILEIWKNNKYLINA